MKQQNHTHLDNTINILGNQQSNLHSNTFKIILQNQSIARNNPTLQVFNFLESLLDKKIPLFIVLSPKTTVVSKETHTNLHNHIYPSSIWLVPFYHVVLRSKRRSTEA